MRLQNLFTSVGAAQALQALADQWWKQHRTFANLMASLDADHDNTIHPHELERALAQLGFSISPEQLRLVVMTFDQNQDGRISRNEVVREILKHKPRGDQGSPISAGAAASAAAEDPDLVLRQVMPPDRRSDGVATPVRFIQGDRNCFVGEYTSFARGAATLAVSINGTPIRGSPFR
jgi:hypothetical protein